RKHLLDGRAKVAADSKTVLAAEQHKAAAEVLHPSAVEIHLLARERKRGEIAEEEKVELLEIFERARRAIGAAEVHGNLFRLQRSGQRAGLLRISVHQQDARLSPEA